MKRKTVAEINTWWNKTEKNFYLKHCVYFFQCRKPFLNRILWHQNITLFFTSLPNITRNTEVFNHFKVKIHREVPYCMKRFGRFRKIKIYMWLELSKSSLGNELYVCAKYFAVLSALSCIKINSCVKIWFQVGQHRSALNESEPVSLITKLRILFE